MFGGLSSLSWCPGPENEIFWGQFSVHPKGIFTGTLHGILSGPKKKKRVSAEGFPSQRKTKFLVLVYL